MTGGDVYSNRRNAGRNHGALLPILLFSLAVTFSGARLEGPTQNVVYPLKVSANRRYLVHQNNTPFLIVGDANTGIRQFTPPGRNHDGESDWVLLLNASSPSAPSAVPPAA